MLDKVTRSLKFSNFQISKFSNLPPSPSHLHPRQQRTRIPHKHRRCKLNIPLHRTILVPHKHHHPIHKTIRSIQSNRPILPRNILNHRQRSRVGNQPILKLIAMLRKIIRQSHRKPPYRLINKRHIHLLRIIPQIIPQVIPVRSKSNRRYIMLVRHRQRPRPLQDERKIMYRPIRKLQPCLPAQEIMLPLRPDPVNLELIHVKRHI